ncbi:hypothetical protein [Kordiimonas pumila]|uniref:Uncharacterized protein n=1 Tax=Kordiimonas pumila TaxID=2161677 RepID=A0ABV7D0V5_9PROT|nr:hypothetical protein [Kordiimonas pumila]
MSVVDNDKWQKMIKKRHKKIARRVMIYDIIMAVRENFKAFMITWVIVILVNQIFIFGACFAIYCLVAALPHTSVIAILITYFMSKGED